MRHRFLEATIGAVPLEKEAMDSICWLTIASVCSVILVIPTQLLLLYAFNVYGHPWSRFFNEFASKETELNQYGVITKCNYFEEFFSEETLQIEEKKS
jgi:hypothetical protein